MGSMTPASRSTARSRRKASAPTYGGTPRSTASSWATRCCRPRPTRTSSVPCPSWASPSRSKWTCPPRRRHAFFGDFQRGGLRLSAELRNDLRGHKFTPALLADELYDSRGWFTAASYRLSDRFEVGSYFTRYLPNTKADTALPSNHTNDTAATLRIDLTRFWNLKIEGHFVDGYGQLASSFARGFYLRDNATPAEHTNMLVIRTGVNL